MKAELTEDVVLKGYGVLATGEKYPVVKYNSTTVVIELKTGLTARIGKDKCLLHGKGWRKK